MWAAQLPCIILNSILIEVSIAHCFIHGMSGVKSEYYPCSCSSLLISLCRYVSFCFSLWFSWQLRQFGAKELIKIWFFNAMTKLWNCSENIAATLYNTNCCPKIHVTKKVFGSLTYAEKVKDRNLICIEKIIWQRYTSSPIIKLNHKSSGFLFASLFLRQFSQFSLLSRSANLKHLHHNAA